MSDFKKIDSHIEAIFKRLQRHRPPDVLDLGVRIQKVKELQEIERQLRTLIAHTRGLQNSYQPPIHLLPHEILLEIFLLCQDHLPSHIPLPTYKPKKKYRKAHQREGSGKDWQWHYLGFVCRRWRAVVARNGVLWSTIDSSTNPIAFLQRSRQAKLVVYLGLRSQNAWDERFRAEVIKKLTPRMGRIEELHVDLNLWSSPPSHSTPGPDAALGAFLDLPASRLRSLTLVLPTFLDDEPVLSNLTSNLPLVFSGNAPELRRLTLGHFSTWADGQFTKLTHLFMYRQRLSSRPSTNNFLDFLECSPLLESMALVDAGPTTVMELVDPPPTNRKVILSKLRRLEIGDWPSGRTISRLLGYMDVQNLNEMFLWGTPERGLIEENENVSSVLPIDPDGMPWLKNVRTLVIVCAREEDDHRLAVSRSLPLHARSSLISLSPILSSGSESSLDRGLELRLYKFSPTQLNTGLPTLLPYTKRVNTLTVRDCTESLVSMQFGSILYNLRHITCLNVLGWKLPRFTLSILESLLPTPPQGTFAFGLVPCPHLQELYLESEGTPTIPVLDLQSVGSKRKAQGGRRGTDEIRKLTVVICKEMGLLGLPIPPRVYPIHPEGGFYDDESDYGKRQVMGLKDHGFKRVKVREVEDGRHDDHNEGLMEVLPQEGIWPTRAWRWVNERRGI